MSATRKTRARKQGTTKKAAKKKTRKKVATPRTKTTKKTRVTKKTTKKTRATKKTTKKTRVTKKTETKKKRATREKTTKRARRVEAPAITLDDGSRVTHDGACPFSIEPFVPLIQKLADSWVMPAVEVEAAVRRLLNPGASTSELAHCRTVGRELFEWGYYTDALDCLERVLRAQPDDAELLELKIAAHENIGESDEAHAWKARLRSSVRRQRPTGRYLIDRFTDALVDNVAEVATQRRTTLAAPIEHLVFGLQDAGSIVPDELWLSLEGSTQVDLELSLTLPETAIPWHVDRLSGTNEEPLIAFSQRFGVAKNLVSWSDPAQAPASLFHLELSDALLRAVDRLTEAGIEIASRCALAVGHRTGDAVVVDRNQSRQRVRELAARQRIAANLKRLPSAEAVEAFAWMCYASSERREWLIGLMR